MTESTQPDTSAEFRRFLDDFLTYVSAERGLAPNTVSAYRRDLATWLAYCRGEGLDPARAAPRDVTDFLARLRDGRPPTSKPLAPSSVARMLVSLRSLYKFLV
ncbi:MAG: site-specific integrase, partial [Actinomycetota bacterium]